MAARGVRLSLLLCIVLIVCHVGADEAKDKYVDAVEGMILLGGFGDALGAPTEQLAFSGMPPANMRTCLLQLGGSFYNSTEQEQNCWGVWPPYIETENVRGVVTDDTAYRLRLLEKYMRHAVAASLPLSALFSESDYKIFLAGESHQLYERNLTYPTDWLLSMQRNMVADWVAMMNTARVTPPLPSLYGNNTFFDPTTPVIFGLYMYLEQAAVLAHLPPSAVYSQFVSQSAFTLQYGADVFALCATLLAQATATDPTGVPYSEWYWDNLVTLINDVGDQSTYIPMINATVHEMHAIGLSLRANNASEAEFLDVFNDIMFSDTILPLTSRTNQDPLVYLGLISSVLAYSEGDVTQGFRLMISCPVDTDTFATFLGQMEGAYYGRKALSAMACQDPGVVSPTSMGRQLQLIEQFLADFFQYDLAEAAEFFWSLSQQANEKGLRQD